MREQFNIDTTEDLSFQKDMDYVTIHLFTGAFVNIARNTVADIYNKMFPREIGHQRADTFVAPIISWPETTLNAPVWRTADNRVIPVTEMTDYHLANALRRVQTIARSYPDTKNILHYKQWITWFGQEAERRRRINR